MKNKIKDGLNIVILTYNSNSTIQKCLDFLKDQTNKNFEVLIVDDDSTDNTLELVKKFSSKIFFNIEILRNGKRNISAGRNIGIRNSKARYVAFLDSDAYANKNWVKNILSAFAKNKNLALVGGREIPIFINNFSKGISINDGAINRIAGNFWAIKGCNFVINKEILKKIYFNEKFIHDEESELIYRIGKNFKWEYNPEIIVNHESRSTHKKYFKQLYKYGIWRIFFSFYSKKFRLVDFYPSLLIILSVIALLINPLIGLLLIPLFSLLETIFVKFYMDADLKFFTNMFLGWLIKNIGWGVGIFAGLIKYPFIKEDLK